MTSRRSYIETLNAGRPKRAAASLDDIALSLQTLESRLERSSPGRYPGMQGGAKPYDGAPRREVEERAIPAEAVQPPRPQKFEPAAYQSIARDIDRMREKEEAVASASKIASEIKALRDELRQQMMHGIRDEFDSLRSELGRAVSSSHGTAEVGQLAQEIERISGAVQSIAERGDEQRIGLLRTDIEDMRQALDRLARDSSPGAAERRWEDFDRRWAAFETRLETGRKTSDPQIGVLADRLQAISSAVDNLPESLSVRSLEERVRMLASSVEQFMRKQEHQAPETLRQLEERLDEISRAIVASAVSAPVTPMDPEPFERIEARISSLARQIEEVMEERPANKVMQRLLTLSERVDALSARDAVPDQAIELLGRQLAMIAEKLERAPALPDASVLFDGIEQRFDMLSAMVERRQGDAIDHGNAMFRDLERRLDEVAARIEVRSTETFDQSRIMDAMDLRFGDLAERLVADSRRISDGGRKDIDGLERRLEDISLRLDASSAKVASIDPKLIRSLEQQVAALSEHLQRPAASLPDLEDIAPRLNELEKAIAGNRDSIMAAAREAAESAVRSIDATGGRADSGALVQDLKALETLTRRSDERNAKTFEAIHDTLIKIVDRLGVFEPTERSSPLDVADSDDVPPAGQFNMARRKSSPPTPSVDLDRDGLPGDLSPTNPTIGRSPAQAASDAVSAALGRETIASDQPAATRSKLLGGLARAFKKEAPASAPSAELSPRSHLDEIGLQLDAPLDAQAANRPLEPGSGTPDLNTILRRVRDEKAGSAKAADADAAKSDFIAAARRAAQAAAAEAEVTKRNAINPDRAERLNIGELVKSKRKPLLMAATALVVVLAGLQLNKAYFGADHVEAETSSMVSEQASPQPASPAAMAVAPMAETPRSDPSASVELGQAATDAARTDTTRQASMMAAEPAAVKSAEADAALSPMSATPPVAALEPTMLPDAESSGAAEDAPGLPAKSASFEIPVEAGPVPLREAAAAGDAKALFEVASRYADGRGVKADMTQAAGWYVKAAHLGLPTAEYRAGNVYEKGLGVDRDVAKAKAFYDKAATHGNVSAMHNLAVLFAMGTEGTPDNESAVRWFTEAADHGVKDSQFNLGILTAKGVGTKQDLEQSYKWFAIVAKTGDRDASSKRDEIANSLRPEQLQRARAAVEIWKAKPVDAAANTVEIPDAWKEAPGATASIDMKKAVSNIQRILNKNGYDAGGSDGVMGDKTKQAIKAFQKDNGLETTGEVDEKLVRTLLTKK